MSKLTSQFSVNCANPSSSKAWLTRIGSAGLACVLLCVLLHNLPVTVMAQEPQTPQPAQSTVQDTTAPAAPTAPERIDIRIELPIVEPFFDIFYEREEPKIEPDVITPAMNPLQELPPNKEAIPQEKLQAQRLEDPQKLLDKLRE
jgi:hypothetical protein